MLAKDDINLSTLDNGFFSQPWLLKDDHGKLPVLHRNIGSGSGGYSDNVFIYAAKELFGQDIQNVNYKSLR